MNRYSICLIAFFSGSNLCGYSQSLDRIMFSNAVSSNNSFETVVGIPYAASLTGTSGSLTVAAEYGESTIIIPLQAGSVEANTLNIYPNPTNQIVNVILDELNYEENSIFLRDYLGQTIWSLDCPRKTEIIDLKSYPNGTYYLTIQGGNYNRTYTIIKSQ
jgi:hypothetical protein